MKDDPVLYKKENTIGIIQFNRPDNRNSMDQEVLSAFKEIIGQAKVDPELRCLIITGSGSTFCAGADFKSNFGNAEGQLPHEVFMSMYQPFLEVNSLKIPTIAAMNGHAIGGGFGLTLMCDMRIANISAKYGANFARLGIHSGMAISHVLPAIVGLPRACELLFTGRIITGETAADIGLVNYAVEEKSVLPKSLELAAEIAASAPVAVQMMKKSIYKWYNWDPSGAAEWEAHCQSRTFEMDDAREGISALLDKRKPKFTGK